MSSQVEIAEINAELKRLESALENLTDTRLREIIEARIKECRARLRKLERIPRRA